MRLRQNRPGVGRRQAVVLTSEPLDRLERKLSSVVCALLMLLELSAVPISERNFENDSTLLVEDELLEVVLVVVLDVELSLDDNRLVSES